MPITPIGGEVKASAAGRAPDAPLLLRVDGLRWQTNDLGDHLVRFREAAIAAGAIVDGKPVSAYSLRHSSIVRSLLAGVPARVVAATHDTSIAELEKTYSAFIADHADTIARRGLLEAPPAAATKMVSAAVTVVKRPPLDDPRWRPLADVYQVRRQQTGNPTLAARDITDALLQDPPGVHCMTRKVNLRLPGPDRDLRAA